MLDHEEGSDESALGDRSQPEFDFEDEEPARDVARSAATPEAGETVASASQPPAVVEAVAPVPPSTGDANVESPAAAPMANGVTATPVESATEANEVVTAEPVAETAASETVADAPVANEPVAAPSRIEFDAAPTRAPAPKTQPSFPRSIAAALEPVSPASYGISPPASLAAQPSNANAAANYAARSDAGSNAQAPGLFDALPPEAATSPAEAAADAVAGEGEDAAPAAHAAANDESPEQADDATRQA
jgi:hypothetical protein